MTYYSMVLALTRRGDVVLVNVYLEALLKPVCAELGVELVACSNSAEEVSELLELLKPTIVVFAVEESGASLNEVRTLVSRAAENRIPVLIDETAIFDITSKATGGGLIGALSDDPYANFPIFIIGLEK
mmetsp:Transcript_5945/g.17904  ORF Transcript_5945/g.17904 Transcript_5945/m.17904 type:complete len:129 (-) Transcript_5945:53-439(-)